MTQQENDTLPGQESEKLHLDENVLKRRTTLVLPQGIPIGVWKHIGRQIFTIYDASSWWLGDWLLYGERSYPERYRRAVAETSLDYQTLRNYAWIARKVEPCRRRENLSFQHHAEVARLPGTEQESWLAKAEKHGWSRNELRKQIRVRAEPQSEEQTYVRIPIETERRHRWQQAADASGQELLDWITVILDRAALTELDG